MEKNDLNQLIDIRTKLIGYFSRLKDYKQNKNAIMREMECAEIIHETVVSIDKILKEHVKFDEKT